MLRPTLLPLDSIRLSWHRLVENLRQQQAPKVHQRRAHQVLGVARPAATIATRPKAVCDGGKETGLLLIQLVRRMVQRLLSQAVLGEALVDAQGRFRLPPLAVNARQLMERRGLSEVTLRAHLRQLQRAGLIVARKFRGTRANFHVWIDPAFVWEVPVESLPEAVEGHSTAPAAGPFSGPNHKNLSLTEVLEPLESQQEKVVQVDKSLLGQKTGTPLLEPGGRAEAGPADAGQAAKGRHQGRAAARVARQAPLAPDAALAARKARAGELVARFFQYARTMLYAQLPPFSAQEQQWAQQAIWEGQYRPALEFAPEQHWDRIHELLLRRVDQAYWYFQRHPEAYPALPWAEVHAGRGYFDAGNMNGFERTRLWLARKLSRKQGGLTALDKALHTAEREIQQRRALDQGLTVQASDRAKRLSLETLHWTHRTLVRRLAGEQGLHCLAARLEQLGLVRA
ncbi:helix-turn-helix domain-containing protein [Hymenobacter yonginensis]|uniref:Replication protein n=1 Tax=Hymenobacter yonginensis TaxID=748197 RepID=A0ABY7PTN8_9BACT|nr:hypothetical protein [Hymenobacter yonginensis]WBO86267.1 hypothetical protein O9Z63_08390 [Hymenobacter yonginensis]